MAEGKPLQSAPFRRMSNTGIKVIEFHAEGHLKVIFINILCTA